MKEMIDTVLANLTEFQRQLTNLRDHVVTIGDVEAAHKTAEANLKSVQSALGNAKADLAQAKAGLSAAQLNNIRVHDEAIFARTKELEDLADRTAAARAEFDTVGVELNTARRHKQDIDDEIASTRKKFA
jgi:chromosome segregation ATPase